MPLYEYQCTKCGQKTEQLQRFEDAPLAACPSCGAPVKKLISSPSFQFKGSGWYATDYAKKGGGGDGGDKGDAAAASSGEGGGGGDTAAGEGSKTGKAKPEGGGESKRGESKGGESKGGESKGGESKGGESKGGDAKGEAKSATKTEAKPAAGGTGG
jgi:putative FmdB family regulatory protein